MRPPERTRIRVSPGAPALLAVFVWLSSPEVLGAVLLAALCHELGHYAALRRRGGHCLLLAVMPLCMAGLCWLLPGRWLRLWSLVLAGGLTLHGTVLSRRVPGGELVWYVLAILVGIAYLLLTVGAPDIGPFADPAAAAMGTIPF